MPGWVVGDAGEQVGNVELRVAAVELGAFDQRVHGGGAAPAGIRRDVMMPGVWGARLRSSIHTIRLPGRPRWSSPIRSMTAVAT
jgi:hypothetical protein